MLRRNLQNALGLTASAFYDSDDKRVTSQIIVSIKPDKQIQVEWQTVLLVVEFVIFQLIQIKKTSPLDGKAFFTVL